VTETAASPSDVLIVAGITPAAGFNTGSDIIGNNKSANFPGIAGNVVLSNGNKTITVTVSGTCTGDCGHLNTGAAATWTYTPATTLTDLAANAAAGSYVRSPAQQIF
jgi:hypothetical protein